MKVIQVWSTDDSHSMTDPMPPEGKMFYLALRYGDVAHPYGPGDWFKEPLFAKCLRFWDPIPLPHFSWRFGSHTGYISLAKAWGMEEENLNSGIYDQFRHWLKPEDVYPGSKALHFSVRNGISVLMLLASALAIAAGVVYRFYPQWWPR